jgi:hypothetical protein
VDEKREWTRHHRRRRSGERGAMSFELRCGASESVQSCTNCHELDDDVYLCSHPSQRVRLTTDRICFAEKTFYESSRIVLTDLVCVIRLCMPCSLCPPPGKVAASLTLSLETRCIVRDYVTVEFVIIPIPGFGCSLCIALLTSGLNKQQ